VAPSVSPPCEEGGCFAFPATQTQRVPAIQRASTLFSLPHASGFVPLTSSLLEQTSLLVFLFYLYEINTFWHCVVYQPHVYPRQTKKITCLQEHTCSTQRSHSKTRGRAWQQHLSSDNHRNWHFRTQTSCPVSITSASASQ